MRHLVQFLALLPLAVPGLVLGLGYVFFFNHPANPLGFVYGTMAILVDLHHRPFLLGGPPDRDHGAEADRPGVRSGLGLLRVPVWRTFGRVTLPVCLPAVLEIAIYLFVNAMTTVSAVVFLYAPDTTLAALAVLNMDDAGDVAPAAAMAMLIFATSALVRVAYAGLTWGCSPAPRPGEPVERASTISPSSGPASSVSRMPMPRPGSAGASS